MYTSEYPISISLDNLLNFIHKYLGDNLSDSLHTKDIVIHIKSEARKDEMRQLLALEDTGAIRIEELQLERDNNIEFEEYLEKYRLYESNGIFSYLTKTSIFNKIRAKIGFPEKIGIREFQKIKENSDKNPYIKTDFFSSGAMYRDWENFKSNIPQFTVFTAKLQVIPVLFYPVFHSLVYREENSSILKIITELYENISSEIGGKRNNDKEIVIFYPLENYLNTQSSIYPVLYELQEKGILKISKQEIKDWKLYFTLRDINNFSLEECERAFRKIQTQISDEIVFKDDEVYINNEPVKFKGKKTKAFQVLRTYFELSQELQKQQINFSDIEVSQKLQGCVKKYDYDNFYNALKDVNERVCKEHNIDDFIGVRKSSLICKYVKV